MPCLVSLSRERIYLLLDAAEHNIPQLLQNRCSFSYMSRLHRKLYDIFMSLVKPLIHSVMWRHNNRLPAKRQKKKNIHLYLNALSNLLYKWSMIPRRNVKVGKEALHCCCTFFTFCISIDFEYFRKAILKLGNTFCGWYINTWFNVICI